MIIVISSPRVRCMSRKIFLLTLYKLDGIILARFNSSNAKATSSEVRTFKKIISSILPVILYSLVKDKPPPISSSNFPPSYSYYSQCFFTFNSCHLLLLSPLENTSFKNFSFLYSFHKYHTKMI